MMRLMLLNNVSPFLSFTCVLLICGLVSSVDSMDYNLRTLDGRSMFDGWELLVEKKLALSVSRTSVATDDLFSVGKVQSRTCPYYPGKEVRENPSSPTKINAGWIYTLDPCHYHYNVGRSDDISVVSRDPGDISDYITESIPQNLIVGGQAAPPTLFKWQAILAVDKTIRCGGVLVHKQLVLTAKHCVNTTSAYRLHVVLGEHDSRVINGFEQLMTVQKIIYPPRDYRDDQGYSDVAILKLSKAATFTKYVRSIRLPKISEDFFDRECFISGFGKLTAYSGTPAVLQYARASIIENDVCRIYFYRPVHDTQICIHQKSSAACMGDSGSPLSCKVGNKWVLAGITSWGHKACLGYPSVYMRITAFKKFIKKERKLLKKIKV